MSSSNPPISPLLSEFTSSDRVLHDRLDRLNEQFRAIQSLVNVNNKQDTRTQIGDTTTPSLAASSSSYSLPTSPYAQRLARAARRPSSSSSASAVGGGEAAEEFLKLARKLTLANTHAGANKRTGPRVVRSQAATSSSLNHSLSRSRPSPAASSYIRRQSGDSINASFAALFNDDDSEFNESAASSFYPPVSQSPVKSHPHSHPHPQPQPHSQPQPQAQSLNQTHAYESRSQAAAPSAVIVNSIVDSQPAVKEIEFDPQPFTIRSLNDSANGEQQNGGNGPAPFKTLTAPAAAPAKPQRTRPKTSGLSAFNSSGPVDVRNHYVESVFTDFENDRTSRTARLQKALDQLNQQAQNYANLADGDPRLAAVNKAQFFADLQRAAERVESVFKDEQLKASQEIARFMEQERANRLADLQRQLNGELEAAIEKAKSDHMNETAARLQAARHEAKKHKETLLSQTRARLRKEENDKLAEMTAAFAKEREKSASDLRAALQRASAAKLAKLREDEESEREALLKNVRLEHEVAFNEKYAKEQKRASEEAKKRVDECKKQIAVEYEEKLKILAEELDAIQNNKVKSLHLKYQEQTRKQAEEMKRKAEQTLEKDMNQLIKQYEATQSKQKETAEQQFQQQKKDKLAILKARLDDDLKRVLLEQVEKMKKTFADEKDAALRSLEAHGLKSHQAKLKEFHHFLDDEKQRELSAASERLRQEADAAMEEMKRNSDQEKDAMMRQIKDKYQQEKNEWLDKMRVANDLELQLAQESAARDFEAAKAMEVEAMRREFDMNRSLALRKLNERLARDKEAAMKRVHESIVETIEMAASHDDAGVGELIDAYKQLNKQGANESQLMEQIVEANKKCQALIRENAQLKQSVTLNQSTSFAHSLDATRMASSSSGASVTCDTCRGLLIANSELMAKQYPNHAQTNNIIKQQQQQQQHPQSQYEAAPTPLRQSASNGGASFFRFNPSGSGQNNNAMHNSFNFASSFGKS